MRNFATKLIKKKMAKPQIAPVTALPITVVNSSPFPPPELTPFSAVSPARFLTVNYRLHVNMSLETIHEEADEVVETSQASSSPPPSFVSSSMCFLEVRRPFPSSYTHSCHCACLGN